ncbi:CAP domain-containing protein [Neorhodopirellula lusitana]|uniref:CAP domain-containing protein n=1 Tax=Neorhodopirellula lusitana TaxID=445327 RepID=UPI0024B73CBA|nr:CAP domain-containing protein [Neorhodopirellula lusitana]
MVRLSQFASVLAVSFVALCAENALSVQNSQGQGVTYQSNVSGVCPKCGKVHAAPARESSAVVQGVSNASSSTVSPVVFQSPAASPVHAGAPISATGVPGHSGQHHNLAPSTHSTSHAGQSLAGQASRGGTSNVLSALNAQRSRQGLGALGYDPTLQAVAERRARLMASTGQKNHPSGSFAPGRYEGVGWNSSYSPAGVSACFTSDPNMRVAGAAMATGRDGVYFCVVYR